MAETKQIDVLRPIPWYKSQALWGQFFAFLGALAIAAPQLASIFPEWSDPILKWGGMISLLLGTWNAVSGRITTTRPIEGTVAADKVADKVAEKVQRARA